METLNKNWFAVTLLAIVFFLLGFLIGKQSMSHPKMQKTEKISWEAAHSIGNKGGNKLMFISEDGNIIIDTLIHKGHKGNNWKRRVKKLLSKDNIKKD